jgi:hypothetical protein
MGPPTTCYNEYRQTSDTEETKKLPEREHRSPEFKPQYHQNQKQNRERT